jgi:hypothetical protein
MHAALAKLIKKVIKSESSCEFFWKLFPLQLAEQVSILFVAEPEEKWGELHDTGTKLLKTVRCFISSAPRKSCRMYVYKIKSFHSCKYES